ncbi:hypothetical protein Tco_1505294 [Tanacetum coccineum]
MLKANLTQKEADDSSRNNQGHQQQPSKGMNGRQSPTICGQRRKEAVWGKSCPRQQLPSSPQMDRAPRDGNAEKRREDTRRTLIANVVKRSTGEESRLPYLKFKSSRVHGQGFHAFQAQIESAKKKKNESRSRSSESTISIAPSEMKECPKTITRAILIKDPFQHLSSKYRSEIRVSPFLEYENKTIPKTVFPKLEAQIEAQKTENIVNEDVGGVGYIAMRDLRIQIDAPNPTSRITLTILVPKRCTGCEELFWWPNMKADIATIVQDTGYLASIICDVKEDSLKFLEDHLQKDLGTDISKKHCLSSQKLTARARGPSKLSRTCYVLA